MLKILNLMGGCKYKIYSMTTNLKYTTWLYNKMEILDLPKLIYCRKKTDKQMRILDPGLKCMIKTN